MVVGHLISRLWLKQCAILFLLQGRNPAATKLAVDPFLRIAGVRDAIALGDCSRLSGAPLPATAQVAPPVVGSHGVIFTLL